MQYCSEVAKSGMMTAFFASGNKKKQVGLACDTAREWAREKYGLENPVCQLATDLYAGAKVISGHEECLNFIEENRADFNIRKTKRLPVSGAFHTPLMRPAVEILQTSLNAMEVHKPRIPVYSNAQNRVYRNDTLIRRLLPKQMVLSVRWEQSMHKMFAYEKEDFIPSIYECGPGSGLSAILLKLNGKVGKRARSIPV